MLKGGCFCKAVRYEVDGAPSASTLCHCADCRRASGAPAMAWFTVAEPEFRWVKGTPKLLHSSPGASRAFCEACGTALTFRHDNYPGEVDVTTGSLDDPEAMPPWDHTWNHSRLSWVKLADELPEYEFERPKA